MAEIQKRTETVVTNFYRLDLSQEEIEVLYAVLGSVSGSKYGYAGVAEGIFGKIYSGLDVIAMRVDCHKKLRGTLSFEDTK